MTRSKFMVMTALVTISVSAAKAETLTPWTNGMVSPNGDAGLLVMSAKRGFDRAFGLDMKIEGLRGDPLVLKALLARQIDSYIGGPASPMVAASKGAGIKIVGCNWNKQSYVLWGNKALSEINAVKGKVIGISTPGSAPDIFIRAALKNSGISPEQVKFLAGGGPADWLKSMAAGVIDAAATPDEYSIRGEQMGLHVLTSSDEATPKSMQRCYFVNGSDLEKRRHDIARFLAAEMTAYQYSTTHREETLALSREWLNVGPDAPEPVAAYDGVVKRKVIDLTFQPPMDKLAWLRDVLADNDMIDRKWDPASMVDLSALEEAKKLVAAKGPVTASAN